MQTRHLTLKLTLACDIRCTHCSEAHLQVDLDVAQAKTWISQLHALKEIDWITLTGGEPFMRYANMLALAQHAATLGLPLYAITNARWAKDAALARQRMSEMAALGLSVLSVSYDPYHAAFVAPASVRNLVQAAHEAGVSPFILYSRGDGRPIGEIKDSCAASFGLDRERVLVRDVVPVGAARDLPPAPGALSYFDLDKRCPGVDGYHILPGGEVFPCYTTGTHAGLALGNALQQPMAEIAAARRNSCLMEMLRQHDLGQIVLRLPECVQMRLVEREYVSACHLCHEIMDDPEARMAAQVMDPATISLSDRLLLAPAAEQRLKRSVRAWRGPPVVSAAATS